MHHQLIQSSNQGSYEWHTAAKGRVEGVEEADCAGFTGLRKCMQINYRFTKSAVLLDVNLCMILSLEFRLY